MTEVALPYLIAYSRVVIGLVFLTSFAGKIRNVALFDQTIRSFQVVPTSWTVLVARLFLAAEVAIALVTLFSGDFWWVGLLLAAVLLSGFCVLLLSVSSRGRGIQTA